MKDLIDELRKHAWWEAIKHESLGARDSTMAYQRAKMLDALHCPKCYVKDGVALAIKMIAEGINGHLYNCDNCGWRAYLPRLYTKD